MNDFGDDNTMEDILGLLWLLDGEIEKSKSEYDRSDMYVELIKRIEDKIKSQIQVKEEATGPKEVKVVGEVNVRQ